MSGGECGDRNRLAAARRLPPVLLLAAGAVTLAALLRPMVAFVEPPPEQLELQRDGRVLRLQRVVAMAPLKQPWQVDADGGSRIRGYRYRAIGTSREAGREVIVWLTSSASSARSSRGYGGAPQAGKRQLVDDGSCLQATGESNSGQGLHRLLPFDPEALFSRQSRDGRNSVWKQLAWLSGSHPIRQKNCYWIEE